MDPNTPIFIILGPQENIDHGNIKYYMFRDIHDP
jgi:hypothetical protein